jgi:hypothetical protein
MDFNRAERLNGAERARLYYALVLGRERSRA